jgi:hypothetical protein
MHAHDVWFAEPQMFFYCTGIYNGAIVILTHLPLLSFSIMPCPSNVSISSTPANSRKNTLIRAGKLYKMRLVAGSLRLLVCTALLGTLLPVSRAQDDAPPSEDTGAEAGVGACFKRSNNFPLMYCDRVVCNGAESKQQRSPEARKLDRLADSSNCCGQCCDRLAACRYQHDVAAINACHT